MTVAVLLVLGAFFTGHSKLAVVNAYLGSGAGRLKVDMDSVMHGTFNARLSSIDWLAEGSSGFPI